MVFFQQNCQLTVHNFEYQAEIVLESNQNFILTSETL